MDNKELIECDCGNISTEYPCEECRLYETIYNKTRTIKFSRMKPPKNTKEKETKRKMGKRYE